MCKGAGERGEEGTGTKVEVRGARCEVRFFGCGRPKWTSLSSRSAETNQELQREVINEDDVVLVLVLVLDGDSRKGAGAVGAEAAGVRAEQSPGR